LVSGVKQLVIFIARPWCWGINDWLQFICEWVALALGGEGCSVIFAEGMSCQQAIGIIFSDFRVID